WLLSFGGTGGRMPWWDSVTPGEFRSVVLLQVDPGGQTPGWEPSFLSQCPPRAGASIDRLRTNGGTDCARPQSRIQGSPLGRRMPELSLEAVHGGTDARRKCQRARLSPVSRSTCPAPLEALHLRVRDNRPCCRFQRYTGARC